MESTISSLRSKIRSLQSEKECLASQLGTLDDEKRKLRDEAASLNKMVCSLREAYADCKAQSNILEAKMHKMIKKDDHDKILGEVTDRLEDYISDSLEFSSIRIRLEKDLKNLMDSNRDLTNRMTKQNETITLRDQEIRSLNESCKAKQKRIDTLESDTHLMKTSHEQEKESLESTHAVALTLLEQSTAAALSKASVASTALDLMQQRVSDLQKENEVLQKERFKSSTLKPLLVSICIGTSHALISSQTQTETFIEYTIPCQVETDPVMVLSTTQHEKIAEIARCGKCYKSEANTFSLFPCGHGCCTECCEEALVQDELSAGGITCSACETSLPVTRIVRNRPLEALLGIILNE